MRAHFVKASSTTHSNRRQNNTVASTHKVIELNECIRLLPNVQDLHKVYIEYHCSLKHHCYLIDGGLSFCDASLKPCILA